MNNLLVFSILMVSQLVFYFALAIVPPFFPTYAKEKGISQFMVGMIFSANSIGSIVAALILGKIMTENNRFKFILTALIMQGFGLLLFGLTGMLNGSLDIITTAAIAAFINGMAYSCFATQLFAYIPELFPDSIEQKIGVTETVGGLGFLFGPILGSWVYQIGGYQAPFILVGSLSLLLVPINGFVFYNLMKSQINDQPKLFITNESSEASVSIQNLDDIPLDYLEVIQSYPVFMLSLNEFMVNFMFVFLSPILADHYDSVYGASPSTIGYYLCVMPAAYSIATLLFGYVQKGKLKLLMASGFVIGIAALFVGPDESLTGLSHKYYYTLTAIAVLGIGSAPMVIYNFPLINSFLLEQYPNQPTQCANMASALFNTTQSLGELTAPLISGLLIQYYSFDTTCSILGYICLIQAVLFIPVFIRYKKMDEQIFQ